MEKEIIDFLSQLLDKNITLSYLVFFFSAIIQMVFPPHPGDVLIIFQGYMTTKVRSFNIFSALFITATGTFIGSLILYKLGFSKGEAVFKYKIVSKFISAKHKERANRVFHKYGHFALLLSKFIPGINAIITLFSGMFKLKPRIVYPTLVISIMVHHIILLLLGRFLGNNMEYIKDIISTYNRIVIGLVVLGILAYAGYWLYRKFIIRNEKQLGE